MDIFQISFISISEHGATSASVYTIVLAGQPFTTSSLGDAETSCASLRSAWCHLLSALACQESDAQSLLLSVMING